MQNKILEALPDHSLSLSSANNFYIVDYTDYRTGDGVRLYEEKPTDIEFVHIINSNEIEVYFDGFENNALPLDKAGDHSPQCECVMFPHTGRENHWILFVELKYADDFKTAFDEEIDYPNCMIRQIRESVSYFREKGIIPNGKRVNAIVSFPKLVREYNSFFNMTIINKLLFDEKILLRATNKARITSEKRIKLG